MSGRDRLWSPRPLHLAVVELLRKEGTLTDAELLKDLRDSFGELSPRELNRVLMKLEISGLIRVSRLMKGKRSVELAERA
jgi:DNA-binding PadR family transcriptional regulator